MFRLGLGLDDTGKQVEDCEGDWNGEVTTTTPHSSGMPCAEDGDKDRHSM